MASRIEGKRETSPISRAQVNAVIGPTPGTVRTIFLGLSGLLATSGKHYTIPEGSPVTAYVDEDIELQGLVALAGPK
jgi:hypothetical protein